MSDKQPSEQGTPQAPTNKPLLKLLVLCAVLAAVILVIYLTPLRDYLTRLPELKDRIRQTGAFAPLIFVLGVALLTGAGFPRLALCPLAGIVFGFFAGLLWVQIGTLLGYYATFLFARWAGRDFILRHRPKLGRFGAILEHQSVATVVLLRTVPIYGGLLNLLLAISSIRHRDFLIGTLIGTTPEAIGATLIGKGLAQQKFADALGYVVVAVALLALAWLLFTLYSRRVKRTRQDSAEPVK